MATSPSSDSPAGNSIPNSPLHDLPQDPLLQPGTFIDPAKKEEVDGKKPASAKPGRKKAAKDTSGRPSWLPEGWTIEQKVRERGATAGTTDRYYFPPNGAGRFRSKKEVENFIRTGLKRKTSESFVADPSESGPSKEKKNSKSGSKSCSPTPPAPLKFDFENIPDSVIWRLKYDGPKELWVPYVDDEMVPESVRQEWDATFKDLASGKI